MQCAFWCNVFDAVHRIVAINRHRMRTGHRYASLMGTDITHIASKVVTKYLRKIG
jgi:hypothetical protein